MNKEKEKNKLADYCLRGLPNRQNFLDNEGNPSDAIFRPHTSQEPRDNRWFELSVNWEDDDTVLEFTQKSKNYRYKGGVVRISKNRLDDAIEKEPCNGYVDYEPSALPKNPYHGNILLDKITRENKARRKAIAGRLKMTITDHILPLQLP